MTDILDAFRRSGPMTARTELATDPAARLFVIRPVFLTQLPLTVVMQDDVQQFGRAPELRRRLPALIVSQV
jgi:hypothetical protein